MEKMWLMHYPQGVAAEVNLQEFASLPDVLRSSCERFANLPACSNMGASMSYAELDEHSRDFAAYLQNALGLRTGDRVALMMPNLLQYPVALFGVLRAGLVVVNVNPRDIAFLQYTGGTTGVAKGAVLTHGNLIANVQQMTAWMTRDLVDGKEVFICPLPLYHVYALTSFLVFMRMGAHTVLVTNPRDMKATIHDLKKYPFTIIIGVNTLYRALLDAPEFVEVDTRSLKLTSAGGMAVQRVVAERWKRRTGVPIIEGYGLTETSPVAISNPLNIADWTGSVGMPIPSTEATILDDDGHEMMVREVGEIGIRGPQVMAGYWGRPGETAQAFTAEGWLRTGDMGFVDERGYFRITDRKKDMIIVSGFKVFPNQIEDVIAMHPGVAEVAAVGVPDERSG